MDTMVLEHSQVAPGPGQDDERGTELMERLAAAAATGGSALAAAQDDVIQYYLPVAGRIARRYSRRGAPVDDLEQQARLGLVQAVQRWQPDRAPSFLAYAVPTIEGSVKRWFRDHLTMVRRPRATQEAAPLIRRAREELAHSLGREPDDHEVAARAGVALEQVRESDRAGVTCNPVSLESQLLPDALVGAGDGRLERVEIRRDLASAWTVLTLRERRVLSLHFWDDLSQAAVGEMIGVSQMQVSRIISKAVGKLSAELSVA
ncbi:sigma-70 family RNA polymerase sigma factor [Nakamurella alba]|nr:sigma-70 family RNA polymerase sigma factor [Nakamurella alba]